jgi:methyl-accepting chemotaxis protein
MMRMTIGRKLALSFGLVLLIFAISGAIVIVQIRSINRNQNEMSKVEVPTSEAAYEMEIALRGVSRNMYGYMHDHNQESLDLIKTYNENFERLQKIYSDLAETQKGKELGDKIENAYQIHKEMAAKLVGLEVEMTQKMEALLNVFEKMDDILDEKIQASIKRSDSQAYEKMQSSMELEININGLAKGLIGYIKTHQPSYENNVHTDQGDFKRFFEMYEGLNLSSQEKQWATELGRLFENDENLIGEIIDLDKKREKGLAEFLEIRREQDNVYDEIQALIHKDLDDTVQAGHKAVQTAGAVALALFILSLVIGSGAAAIINRGISNPLRSVVSRINEIARTAGDLTAKLRVSSRDEVGDLATGFNRMLGGLKEMIVKITNNSQGVSASSQQLSAASQQTNASIQQVASTIQQLSRGAQTQAQRVEEIIQVMEQLNTSIAQTSQSNQEAASASTQANHSAQKGAEAVRETVSAINKIFDSATVTSEAVKKLSQRSEQIKEIVEVITNIADQTNLLALNAAIEAARAGEAGKGFAVVAEEVRKLAENSAESASEIAQLIKETTGETETAVKNMDISAKEVSSGKEMIDKAGMALEEIMQSSQNVSSMLQQISASSQQMSSGSKQVVKAVEDLAAFAEETSASSEQASASTQQMAATMQEMASSAQSLAQMSMDLNSLVAEFKTGNEERKLRPELRTAIPRQAAQPLAQRLAEAKKKMEKVRQTKTDEHQYKTKTETPGREKNSKNSEITV